MSKGKFLKISGYTALFLSLQVGCLADMALLADASQENVKDEQVCKKVLVAVKNVFDVKEELKRRLEDLEDKEKSIIYEKRELQNVVKDIENTGIFPKDMNGLSVGSRGIMRRLKKFEARRNSKVQEQTMLSLEYEKRSKSKLGKAVAIGTIVGAVVSVALGFAFWKGCHSKVGGSRDGVFADGLTRYLERVV